MLPVLLTLLGAIEIGEWSAPGCPASLLAERARATVTPVRVSVQARGDLWVGSLEVSRDGKTRRRTHEAPTCEALIDALALGVELAQAPPDAKTVVPNPPPPKRSAQTVAVVELPVATPETPPVPEPVVVAAAKPPPPLPEPSPPPAVVATLTLPERRPEPGNPTRVELAAHALVLYAPAPGPTFGVEASVSLLPAGAFRVELSLQHARSATLDLGPSRARFSLTTARLGGCSPTLKVGAAAGSLCASVAAGAVWAQGFASATIGDAREVTLPWFDVAAQGRVAIALTRSLTLEARAGPTFPLNRHTFVFEAPRVTLHSIPFIGFEAAVGLVIKLPGSGDTSR